MKTLSRIEPDEKSLASNPALPAGAYLASLRTEVSRAGITSALNTAAEITNGERDWRIVDWSKLNAAIVKAIMAQAKGAAATRNKLLSAMKGTARAAWQLGCMSLEDFEKIRSVKGDSASRLPKGRDIRPDELRSLLDVCEADKSAAGRRDAAILAIAAATGARRAELASIRTENIRCEDGLTIIRLVGKRDKERELYLHNGSQAALNDWLAVRGNHRGALFVSIGKAGRIGRGSISTTAMHKLLARRATQARVKGVSLHDFRRTVTGDLLDKGADLVSVAALLGHASVNTTARYDRRGQRARIAASALVSVPYRAAA
jgi:integrase